MTCPERAKRRRVAAEAAAGHVVRERRGGIRIYETETKGVGNWGNWELEKVNWPCVFCHNSSVLQELVAEKTVTDVILWRKDHVSDAAHFLFGDGAQMRVWPIGGCCARVGAAAGCAQPGCIQSSKHIQ